MCIYFKNECYKESETSPTESFWNEAWEGMNLESLRDRDRLTTPDFKS